ncbi:MAG: 30S ribosomal protein S15 [Candidatus Nanohaloarchaea archaeon]|nr:30S ribosomal protein S15 [Candidatus Nanohaloarchaea archaeon]
MSRMHSDRRGQSGSTRPRSPDVSWVVYDESEVEQLVEKLANQGKGPSAIGQALRDRYGIPDVKAITDRSITEILEEQEMKPDVPEDLFNLMQKAVRIDDHLDENPNDLEARRNKELTEAKIRRLADYYRGDELEEDWSYSLEKARLMTE